MSNDEIRDLLRHPHTPQLTICLPIDAAQATPEVRLKLKHLVDEATSLLRQRLPAEQARVLLQLLHVQIEEGLVCPHGAQALMIFVAPGFVRSLWLPYTCDALVLLGDQFYIMPLLSHRSAEQAFFYILALSQKHVRLFASRGAGDGSAPIRIQHGPLSNVKPFDHARWHYPGARHAPQRGTLYAQGEPADYAHAQLLQYCHEVDQAIREALGDSQRPLVLAGLEEVQSTYREANSYASLCERGVSVNPDHLTPRELQQRAWSVVGPSSMEIDPAAIQRYRELISRHEHRTSDDIHAILPAAAAGLVQELFIAPHTRCWGEFEPKGGLVVVHEERRIVDDELLNLAAVHTLLSRGKVYSLPEELAIYAPIAATLRCRLIEAQ